MKIYRSGCVSSVLTLLCFLSACNSDSTSNETALDAASTCEPILRPNIWPKQSPPLARDPKIESRVAALLKKMTLEEKVGQVIQPDIASITPDEVKKYHIGSVLNGGNSAPGGDNRASAEEWLKLADQFWLASTDTSDGGAGIPALWGTDAVHGHSNIVGATIFPHNIGLGAANDLDLMYRIGQVTAKEILVTGLDWTFAPTIAVARNDRWGRAYESYSEDPTIIRSFTGKLVTGLQGTLGADDFLGDSQVLSTAKHFVGDGGTHEGLDQGDNRSSEEELRDVHAAGYPVAIKQGVQVVMASFNSWCGKKAHGFRGLLNDVLVDQMGFDGFVVGDWNGHGQVKGCTNTSCSASFNAGLDMFMAPDSWEGLYKNMLKQVKSGEISQERLNEAVGRILRVKLRMGLFDAKKPSERKFAGQFSLLGSAEHRAVAREAVRKSLVLLKNNQQLLPLSRQQRVLVAGESGDDIGLQSGGWTLSWQGTGNQNSDFPNGQSIYDGIKEAVEAAGGSAFYSKTGSFTEKPDVAVVVFGEEPYAEFQGDRPNVDFEPEGPLSLLNKLQKQGIPTVSVFLSGRPLWVNPEINASDAFVAAWLPGTEGAGIADVIFRKPDGSVNFDFAGKLSFSWPKTATDAELNWGNDDYDPLFAYGYGLTYKDSENLANLSENSGLDDNEKKATRNFILAGDAVNPWRMVLRDASGAQEVDGSKFSSPSGALSIEAMDDRAQEDSSLLSWSNSASFFVEGGPTDLSGLAKEGYAMSIRYRLHGVPGRTTLQMACGAGCQGAMDVTQQLAAKVGTSWQVTELGLNCFAELGADLSRITRPFEIISEAPTKIQVTEVRLIKRAATVHCAL